ncbi:MAG: YncE family protein [Spirosomataceae bacterium]
MRTYFIALMQVLLLNCVAFGQELQLVKRTTIGGEGGWDYLFVSSEDRRLYLSHANQVEVLNVDTHEKMGTIPDTKGVHGIVAIPSLNKGFITCGRTNSVVVFDIKTLAKLSELPTDENPDALLYDHFSKRVFVFNHKGGSVTVIDPQEMRVIQTIKLGGSAAEAGVSNQKGLIFVNLEDLSEVVSFDANTLEIKNRWKVAPGEEPTGLAIDLKDNRLITVCKNKKMIILDATTGKVIAEVGIGERCDGVVFDPKTNYAYTSNGEGSISVVHKVSPSTFELKETIKTEVGARTIAIDNKTRHIFTITAQFGEPPTKTDANPRPRPPVLPNTFAVLEFGK